MSPDEETLAKQHRMEQITALLRELSDRIPQWLEQAGVNITLAQLIEVESHFDEDAAQVETHTGVPIHALPWILEGGGPPHIDQARLAPAFLLYAWGYKRGREHDPDDWEDLAARIEQRDQSAIPDVFKEL